MTVCRTVKYVGVALPANHSALMSLLPGAQTVQLLNHAQLLPQLSVRNMVDGAACSALMLAFGELLPPGDVSRVSCSGAPSSSTARRASLMEGAGGGRRALHGAASAADGTAAAAAAAGSFAAAGNTGVRARLRLRQQQQRGEPVPGRLGGRQLHAAAAAGVPLACGDDLTPDLCVGSPSTNLRVSLTVPANASNLLQNLTGAFVAAVQKMRSNASSQLLVCGAPICLDNITTVSEVLVTQSVQLSALGYAAYRAVCSSKGLVPGTTSAVMCLDVKPLLADAPPPPPSKKSSSNLAMIVGASAAGFCLALLLVGAVLVMLRRRRQPAAELAPIKEAPLLKKLMGLPTPSGSSAGGGRDRPGRMTAAARSAAASSVTTTGMRWPGLHRSDSVEGIVAYDSTSGAPKPSRSMSMAGAPGEEGASRAGSVHRLHSIHRASFRQLQAADAAVAAAASPSQKVLRSVMTRVTPALPVKGILRQGSARFTSEPGSARAAAALNEGAAGGISDSGAAHKAASAAPPGKVHSLSSPGGTQQQAASASAAASPAAGSKDARGPREQQLPQAHAWGRGGGPAAAAVLEDGEAACCSSTTVSPFSFIELAPEQRALVQELQQHAASQQGGGAEAERAAVRKDGASWLAGGSSSPPLAPAIDPSDFSTTSVSHIKGDGEAGPEPRVAGSGLLLAGNTSSRRVRFALPPGDNRDNSPAAGAAPHLTGFPGAGSEGAGLGDVDGSRPSTPDRVSEQRAGALAEAPPLAASSAAPSEENSVASPYSDRDVGTAYVAFPLAHAPLHGMLLLGQRQDPAAGDGSSRAHKAPKRGATDRDARGSRTERRSSRTAPVMVARPPTFQLVQLAGGPATMWTMAAPPPPAAQPPTAKATTANLKRHRVSAPGAMTLPSGPQAAAAAALPASADGRRSKGGTNGGAAGEAR